MDEPKRNEQIERISYNKEKIEMIRDKVQKMIGIVAELEAEFPGRHFTLDGHLIGSIGEVMAAYYYGIELFERLFSDSINKKSSAYRPVAVNCDMQVIIIIGSLYDRIIDVSALVVDPGHDILVDLMQRVKIDIVLMGLHLGDLLIRNGKAQGLLRFRQNDPKLPPQSEFILSGKKKLHFFAGVAGGKRGKVSVGILRHGRSILLTVSAFYQIIA